MTNAEKYLKDGETGDFVQAFSCWYYGITRELENADKMLVQFLKAETKPTLTEDERVILRNIKNDDFGKYIGRGDVFNENRPRNFNLYLRGDDEYRAYAIGSMYNHLFQFIKERRRILY